MANVLKMVSFNSIVTLIEGWDGPEPGRHHDFIDVQQFPKCRRDPGVTVEVEAKAKEMAVLRLKRLLAER